MILLLLNLSCVVTGLFQGRSTLRCNVESGGRVRKGGRGANVDVTGASGDIGTNGESQNSVGMEERLYN
jgi:hypothetical protein